MDIKKLIEKQLGINLDELQKEGAKVPQLLEAIALQGNGQVKALKTILANQKNIKGQLDHITHYLQAKGMR